MEHEGNLTLLSRLKRGEGRVGLLILPGGMRGVYGGAAVAAMEHAGLRNNFTVIAGCSTGAPAALFFAGGVATRGRLIYQQECTTRSYMDPWSFRRAVKGNTIDLDYLCNIFRGVEGANAADIDAMRACRADVYVGATDYETGRGAFVDLKTAEPDPVTAVHASIAVPLVYRKPVYVNGRRYLDGDSAMPFPAREMVERWNLDGLVVIANRSRVHELTRLGNLADYLVMSTLPPGPRFAARRRFEVYAENLAYLRGGKTQYLVVWSDDEVGLFERNSLTLRRAGERAYAHMAELLTRAG